jgi:hypothetical protein
MLGNTLPFLYFGTWRDESSSLGRFGVIEVPEPATLTTLALGGLLVLGRQGSYHGVAD